MPEPTFNIGDAVTFEMGPRDEPRWDFNNDLGRVDGKEIWIIGKVKEIQFDYSVLIRYNVKDMIYEWAWPLAGNNAYSQDQWIRPGYLVHISAPAISLSSRAEIAVPDNT